MGILSGKPPPEPKPEEKPEPDRELTELEREFGWRLEQLIVAGYPVRYAQRIALHREISLREAERLLDEGCPPKTAVDILL